MQTYQLPCECIPLAAGRNAAAMDVTQCHHFRDYHHYAMRDAAAAGVEKEKPWNEHPHLDGWVIDELRGSRRPPHKFRCETTEWAKARARFIGSGTAFNTVVLRCDTHQELLNEALVLPQDVLDDMRHDMAEGWRESRRQQASLRRLHDERADALLGFAVADEAQPSPDRFGMCPVGDYPDMSLI